MERERQPTPAEKEAERERTPADQADMHVLHAHEHLSKELDEGPLSERQSAAYGLIGKVLQRKNVSFTNDDINKIKQARDILRDYYKENQSYGGTDLGRLEAAIGILEREAGRENPKHIDNARDSLTERVKARLKSKERRSREKDTGRERD